MPYSIEWINNDVIITYSGGTIKTQDVLDVNNELYGDARFDDMNYQISDFNLIDEIEVKESDILIIAALDKVSSRWNPKMKLANVTQNKLGIKMIEKYAEILVESGWDTKVFENMEDAIKWCTE